MPPRSLPAAAFEDVAFWDARYSVDDEAFDWYELPSIGVALAAIERALTLSSSSTSSSSPSAAQPAAARPTFFSLLDIGCGTSLLAERISERRRGGLISFERIVACDASEVAIEKQRQRQAERQRRLEEQGEGDKEEPDSSSSSSAAAVVVSYEIADAFKLPYGDASFDAVVDKGTADALDCGGCEGGSGGGSGGGGGSGDVGEDDDDDKGSSSVSISECSAAGRDGKTCRVLKV